MTTILSNGTRGSAGSTVPDQLPLLDEDSAELYRFAARRGFLDVRGTSAPGRPAFNQERLRRSVATLVALRLLMTSPDSPSVLLPVSPAVAQAVAQAEFVSPLALEISRRQHKVDVLSSSLEALVADYDAVRPRTLMSDGFELLSTTYAMRAMFDMASRECKDSVTIVYSGASLTVDRLAATVPYELALLDRGISLRILLPHKVRASITLEANVRQRYSAGAQLRTSAQAWAHDIALFDDNVALTPFSVMVEDQMADGLVVRSPIMLRMLVSIIEWAWHSGVPLGGPDGDDDRVAASELTAAVASLLEKGLKDEAVARKLGISLRTCRKHIAHLMQDLDAASRFQAGAHAVRRGLLD